MMYQMMNVADDLCDQGFHIIDDFLINDDYLALCELISAIQEAGRFRPAKIGHQLNKMQDEAIRNDQIYWLDKQDSSPAIMAYFAKIEALSECLNQTLFLGLIDYEAHIAIYQPNQFYKKHIDQFATQQDRRISCVYYLNDNWEEKDGGELRIYDTEHQPLTTILPEGNRFVCFNSNLPHEVCVAHKNRYSIAAWLKSRRMNLYP